MLLKKYRTSTFYTDKQEARIWDRWQRGGTHGQITDTVRMRERPAEADDRTAYRVTGFKTPAERFAQCVASID